LRIPVQKAVFRMYFTIIPESVFWKFSYEIMFFKSYSGNHILEILKNLFQKIFIVTFTVML